MRILQACREEKVPEPRVRLSEHELWLEFAFSAGHIRAVSSRTGGERPTEAAGEASVKTSVKASVKTGDALLELLRKNPPNDPGRGGRGGGPLGPRGRDGSSKLVTAGRLRFVGPQRGVHWEVLP